MSLLNNQKPKVTNSEPLFDGFVKIRNDMLTYPNGHTQPYFVMETRSDAVIVLGIFENGDILLNEEFRHPCNRTLLCLPGGFLEPEEAIIEGGKREFFEETGYQAESYEWIGSSYPFPGICSQQLHFVRAKNIFPAGDTQREPSEIIQNVRLSKQALQERIKQSQNIDGILCTCLYFHNIQEL